MQTIRQFSELELLIVDEAAKASEELVNNYFKMSSGQWLKNRYDINTAKDLAPHEQIIGPVAQVIKYEARQKEVPLGSSSFNLYKICVQDGAVLSTIEEKGDMGLGTFLLYVITHELVHVVRFSKYQQRYENKNEADVTMGEEKKVHQLTYSILNSTSISGIGKVFEFYKDWFVR
jgi:hypothetical protein